MAAREFLRSLPRRTRVDLSEAERVQLPAVFIDKALQRCFRSTVADAIVML